MGIIWELDFYSRPILDEQNKKTWEVLIHQAPLSTQDVVTDLFQYAQFCPSTQVNSVWLKAAIEEAIAQSGQTPSKIRFFRRQMTNMITRACEELGIQALPTRRTSALNQWLQRRAVTVYPELAGYQGGTFNLAASTTSYALPDPQPLPDALLGQQWAFVTLEAGAFAEMADWQIDFGEAFPLALLDLPPDAKIPGLVIFSPRALPLAGWMSGLELDFLKYSPEKPARLILETGVSERWILANLPKPEMQREAANFEAAKEAVQQVHFIAVQSDPRAESFAGFWLLQELNLA